MQKSSFGAIGIMIGSMVLSGCAGKNLAALDAEGLMAAPGNKVFVTYESGNCPSEKSGITCLVEKEAPEEGMLAYAKENNTSVLVAEQVVSSSGALGHAALTFARIGAAATGGAAGQGFAIGTAGGPSPSHSTEFSAVINGNFSKIDCGDFSDDDCRRNLQKLMMGLKIASSGKNASIADQDMAEYMKRNSK